MLIDYHVHSEYSADSAASLSSQLEAARRAGVTHICFTDHVDFDGCTLKPADIAARNAALEKLRGSFRDIDISLGVEIGMKDAGTSKKAFEHLSGCELDFVIGSIHLVKGVDAYYPEYFVGKDKKEAFGAYLSEIAESLPHSKFSVLGHYDFCAKYSPYPDRAMRLDIAPELFDTILRHLVQNGRGMEINTAAWRDSPSWGLDVLRRYRELGGEFVTTGSDAHKPNNLGKRLDEAMELARAAGIPYIATFKRMKPVFHKL